MGEEVLAVQARRRRAAARSSLARGFLDMGVSLGPGVGWLNCCKLFKKRGAARFPEGDRRQRLACRCSSFATGRGDAGISDGDGEAMLPCRSDSRIAAPLPRPARSLRSAGAAPPPAAQQVDSLLWVRYGKKLRG